MRRPPACPARSIGPPRRRRRTPCRRVGDQAQRGVPVLAERLQGVGRSEASVLMGRGCRGSVRVPGPDRCPSEPQHETTPHTAGLQPAVRLGGLLRRELVGHPQRDHAVLGLAAQPVEGAALAGVVDDPAGWKRRPRVRASASPVPSQPRIVATWPPSRTAGVAASPSSAPSASASTPSGTTSRTRRRSRRPAAGPSPRRGRAPARRPRRRRPRPPAARRRARAARRTRRTLRPRRSRRSCRRARAPAGPARAAPSDRSWAACSPPRTTRRRARRRRSRPAGPPSRRRRRASPWARRRPSRPDRPRRARRPRRPRRRPRRRPSPARTAVGRPAAAPPVPVAHEGVGRAHRRGPHGDPHLAGPRVGSSLQPRRPRGPRALRTGSLR